MILNHIMRDEVVIANVNIVVYGRNMIVKEKYVKTIK